MSTAMEDLSALLGAFSVLPPNRGELGAASGNSGAGGSSGSDGSGGEGRGGQQVILPSTPPPGMVEADSVVQELAHVYRDLVAQAARMTALFGVNVPCKLQAAHNEAVGAYIAAARQTFNQILAQNPKTRVIQKIYDQSGRLLGSTMSATPVMPPTFRTTNCPNTIPTLSGPAIIGVRSEGLGVPALLGWGITIIIALVTGTTILLAERIYVNRPQRPLEAVQARKVWVDMQLNCVDRQLDQVRRTGGKPDLEKAKQSCGLLIGSAPPNPEDPGTREDTFWLKAIAVGGATLVGGFILYRWLTPSAYSMHGAVAPRPKCKRLERKRRY